MYSISGLPPEVSGAPETAAGGVDTLPAPTWARVLAGTLVVSAITLASAAPVGPLDALVVGVLELSLATTKTITITRITTTAPDTMSTRLRTARRRSAARWAAIRSRRPALCPAPLALLIAPACAP